LIRPTTQQASIIKAAWKYAERDKTHTLEQLAKLVGQPSVSAQRVGLEDCAELVLDMMNKLGIATRIFQTKNSPSTVYGTLDGKNPRRARTLVFYNHYDVQPAEPLEEWNSYPFKIEARGGLLFGRGTADDKGDIAARLSAIRSILNTEGSIVPNLRWVIEGEEEVGSPHLRDFAKQHKPILKGDGCLWEGGHTSLQGTPEISLGVKGILYVEFQLAVGQRDQHSMYAPLVPNPAWRLVELLRSIRNKYGGILIDGFYDDVVQPSAKDRQLIKKIEFSSRALRKALGVDSLIEGKSDLDLHERLLYSPTANIAGFSSGYEGIGSKTIIPRKALVKMDFRLVANMTSADILAKLRRHLVRNGFRDVRLLVHSMQEPAKTSAKSHIAQTLIRCARMVYHKEPTIRPTSPATGPMSVFANTLKLETVSGAGVVYPKSAPHAPNEHIVLKHFGKGIRQLICLLNLF
jgi:acetylornithine deacetylase/succinyl-diaminopimelate desuccinylase-like protein